MLGMLESTKSFGIHKLNTLVNHWPNAYESVKRNLYLIIFTKDEKTCLYLNNILFEIPAYSAIFISNECSTRFVEEEVSNPDILFFSDLFYERNTHDALFIRNSSLFDCLENPFILAIPSTAKSYTETLLNLLYDAENNNSNQTFVHLAHNVIEQILLISSVYGKRELLSIQFDNLDHKITANFKNLLVNHIQDQKSVRFYAERLNITPRRLGKATFSSSSLTPKEMILEYLIKEAKRMLIYNPELSIKEVAYALGYADENNFSALFMKEVKISPKNYRKHVVFKQIS